jgi:FG-GAP repeat
VDRFGTNERGDRFGAALAAGDFDGDRIADLAVGIPGEAPGSDPAMSGFVFVFRGTRSGLVVSEGLEQELMDFGTNELGDAFGSALAAGDFNGDGRADLAVGAPGEAPGNGPRSGFVFVFRGTPAGLRPERGVQQEMMGFAAGGGAVTNEEGDAFGSVLLAADFNADGRADLAVSAPGRAIAGAAAAGTVFLLDGSAEGLVPAGLLTQATNGLGTSQAGDRYGLSLAAGDVNRDGRADLVVGAPLKNQNGATDSGTAFVYVGQARGLRGAVRIDSERLGLLRTLNANGNDVREIRSDPGPARAMSPAVAPAPPSPGASTPPGAGPARGSGPRGPGGSAPAIPRDVD